MRSFWMIAGAFLLAAVPALAGDDIGYVKNATGTVSAERGGSPVSLVSGSKVCANDVLVTGAEASLGVILIDDTTLSLGPKGRLVLDSFVFEPGADKLGMRLSLAGGTLAMITGEITRLAPERTRITTPVMSIGIRGTSLLVSADGDGGGAK